MKLFGYTIERTKEVEAVKDDIYGLVGESNYLREKIKNREQYIENLLFTCDQKDQDSEDLRTIIKRYQELLQEERRNHADFTGGIRTILETAGGDLNRTVSLIEDFLSKETKREF